MGVNGSKQSIDHVWPVKGKEKAKAFEAPTAEWWAEMKEKQKVVDERINRKIHK